MSIEEFQQSKTLVLLPHGRIEGILRVGRNPGANRPLGLTAGRPPLSPISFQIGDFRIQTDAQGRFKFEGVPAGQISIMEQVATSPGSSATLRSTQVEVKPGQTTEVTLGGDGANVKGQVRWPASPEFQTVTNLYQLCQLRDLDPANIVRDPRANAIVPRYYGFRVQENGAFEAADIPPGTYELTIEFREGSANNPFAAIQGKVLGSFQRQIQISAATDDINMGEVALSAGPVIRSPIIPR